jgi:hypothetical protein
MDNKTNCIKKGGKKPHAYLLPMMVLVLFGMIALMGVAAADDYFKGGLLTTNNDISKVDAVTGSGDFWYQANNCWNSTSGLTTYTNTSTFTIPAAAKGNASWARLWVAVYMGNMTDNSYQGTETITLNNGSVDELLADQDLDPTPGVMNLDYYPAIGITHADPNLYEPNTYFTDLNRVTSDYINEFNVTSLINNASSQTIIVNTTTNRVSGNFDGRIKAAVLAIGYNDSDITNDKYYWVNVGHDTMTKNATDPSVYNYTTFNDLPNYNSTAQLDAIFLASADGMYKYSNTTTSTDVTLNRNSPGVKGAYFGYDIWTIPYSQNEDINFFYNRNYPSQSYYKVFLAFLTANNTANT